MCMVHIKISLCADMTEQFQNRCLIGTRSCQQYDPKHWYTYISHYWHMPTSKYACHTAHICPIALHPSSTYRHNITALINKNMQL